MTITETISQVEHYTWWFNTRRESFVLEENGQALLYVWHQLYEIENKEYLIGGWFAANDSVNFVHAQLILDWQLNFTQAQWPNAHWLAVINKDNKFVNLLNQRAGFVPIEKDSAEYQAVQTLFSKASEEDFNYVAKYASHLQ
jgi:hypothetical protein